MRRALVALAIFALVSLVACGGEEGWGEEARAEFIAGCEDGGATNEMCICLQDKLEAKYPDAEDPADFESGDIQTFAKECANA